jgi:hypothetical protein
LNQETKQRKKMNLLAYILYLGLSGFITIVVGKFCHKHGIQYIINLMPDDEHIAHAVNNTLLVLYYLLNIGYATLMLIAWQTITSYTQLVEAVSTKLGIIIITLAVIHYGNMLTIFLISKYKTQHKTNNIF